MIDIYAFVEECRENGLDAYEAGLEYSRACAEERDAFMEDYYNDPVVQAGWAQQDLIDAYRRER